MSQGEDVQATREQEGRGRNAVYEERDDSSFLESLIVNVSVRHRSLTEVVKKASAITEEMSIASTFRSSHVLLRGGKMPPLLLAGGGLGLFLLNRSTYQAFFVAILCLAIAPQMQARPLPGGR